MEKWTHAIQDCNEVLRIDKINLKGEHWLLQSATIGNAFILCMKDFLIKSKTKVILTLSVA